MTQAHFLYTVPLISFPQKISAGTLTNKVKLDIFLHNRSWISPWIESISNELDVTIHVIASQLSGHFDIISNRFWRRQQNVDRASEPRGRCVKIVERYFCVYFPRCFATLSWALKQFVTPVNTFFDIYIYIYIYIYILHSASSLSAVQGISILIHK